MYSLTAAKKKQIETVNKIGLNVARVRQYTIGVRKITIGKIMEFLNSQNF